MLTAITVAAVVCIASSNGGTTSQDLKTGFLVGATPYKQQWAIIIGSLTSALVIAGTMLLLNKPGRTSTRNGYPNGPRRPGRCPREVGEPPQTTRSCTGSSTFGRVNTPT